VTVSVTQTSVLSVTRQLRKTFSVTQTSVLTVSKFVFTLASQGAARVAGLISAIGRMMATGCVPKQKLPSRRGSASTGFAWR
jgi:hypothetical protein